MKTYLIAAAVLLLLLTGSFATGYSRGKNSERQAWELKVRQAEKERIKSYEDELTQYNVQALKDASRAGELTRQVLELRSERDLLATARVPLVITKEVPVNVQGKCDQSVLSTGFGLCLEAAVTGEPAVTAACRAAGSNAGTATGASF